MIYLDEFTEINHLPVQAVKHLTILDCLKKALIEVDSFKDNEVALCAAHDVAISIMKMITSKPIIKLYSDWSCKLSSELFKPKIDNENDMSLYQACLNHLEVDMRMLYDPKNP